MPSVTSRASPQDAGWSAGAVYDGLIRGVAPTCDPFDAHVLASILTIAADEARSGRCTLTDGVGLQPEGLAALLRECFPGAPDALHDFAVGPIMRAADEECLLDLLRQAATSGALAVAWLAPMVARRAQRPDHLWQDLGLRARTELSVMMLRHFRVLALRNARDMKWKKYLYRVICGDSGYALCTAPSCNECADFEACFGDESGESFLARVRRDAEFRAD